MVDGVVAVRMRGRPFPRPLSGVPFTVATCPRGDRVVNEVTVANFRCFKEQQTWCPGLGASCSRWAKALRPADNDAGCLVAPTSARISSSAHGTPTETLSSQTESRCPYVAEHHALATAMAAPGVHGRRTGGRLRPPAAPRAAAGSRRGRRRRRGRS